MENLIKKDPKLINLVPIASLFLIFTLYIFSILEYEISLAEYVLIENLINYQGGFVRRGLLGDIIFKLYYYTGVNHIKIIICIYLSAYFLFIILFYKILEKIWPINPYLFLFISISPSTLFFPLFDFDALFRKEIFFFIVFFYHVCIAQQTIQKKKSVNFYKKQFLLIILPGLIISLLIHEFQFFLIFFHIFINLFILGYKDNKKFFLSYFILFLIFLFFLFPESLGTIDKINYSLEKFLPGISEKYTPVTILTGNINLQLGQTLGLFKNSNFSQLFQLIFIFIFSIPIYLLVFFTLIKKNAFINSYHKNLIILLNVFSFFVLILFIILSFDYGRLFYIFLIHMIGFYLVLPHENYKISKSTFVDKLKYSFLIISYFIFFYLPHAHIVGNKGSIFDKLNNGLFLFLK